MKSIYGLAAAILLFTAPLRANPEFPSKAEEVTFFLSGAQVKRSAAVTLESGVQQLVLSGLEPGISPSSIILAGVGDFTILSYRYDVHTIPAETRGDDTPEIRTLRKQLRAVEDSLSEMVYWQDALNFRLEVLNNEKRLLLNNDLNQGTAIGDSLQLLSGTVTYLRERLSLVNDELVAQKREQAEYHRTREALNQRKRLLDQDLRDATVEKPSSYDYRLMVSVEAERATAGQIHFSYVVQSAGWAPEIEFRSNGYGQPIAIQQRARIYQQTGMEWSDVELFVSTSNPASHQNKPMLQPWVLALVSPVQNIAAVQTGVYMQEEAQLLDAVVIEDREVARLSSKEVQVQVSQQLAYQRFSFDRTFSIRSGHEFAMRVKLKRADLPCTYRLVAVPKLSSKVFVEAQLPDWQEYMLPGADIKLYYENTYLGDLRLSPRNYADTLRLSMGVDDGIRVQRELVMEKSKSQVIGRRVKQERIYRFTAENFKSTPVELFIEDQWPLSRQEDLTVERLDCLPGQLNSETGMVVWRLDLDAKGRESFECGFEVSYPKDRELRGL